MQVRRSYRFWNAWAWIDCSFKMQHIQNLYLFLRPHIRTRIHNHLFSAGIGSKQTVYFDFYTTLSSQQIPLTFCSLDIRGCSKQLSILRNYTPLCANQTVQEAQPAESPAGCIQPAGDGYSNRYETLISFKHYKVRETPQGIIVATHFCSQIRGACISRI